MRVKGGVEGQKERGKAKKKTLGAIIPGSVLAAAVFFFVFFCNFNMFLCTSSLGAITAYRLLMSSNFDKLLNWI